MVVGITCSSSGGNPLSRYFSQPVVDKLENKFLLLEASKISLCLVDKFVVCVKLLMAFE